MSTQTPRFDHLQSGFTLTIPEFADERGKLSSVTAFEHVPFVIERVYWITGIPSDAYRGGHAHRTVAEMLVAVTGRFRVRWDDAGGSGEAVLEAPNQAVVLPPLAWRHLDQFTPGAACLVLASGPFDPAEYVDTREEFDQLLGQA